MVSSDRFPLVVFLLSFLSWPAFGSSTCIIVTGLGGLPEYEENFLAWAGSLEKTFREELGMPVHNLDGRNLKRTDILQVFHQVSASPLQDEVWLFLIGHGNHDGSSYRFHISGPDLTDGDLKAFLDGLGDRRAYVVAATGASGSLIPHLSRRNRVIVSATKNQFERQPPLFLSFFIEAATSAQADTDKNGKVSLLEAFVFSQKQVANWFEERGRLQTEHPLIDDTTTASLAYLSAPPERAYRTLEAQQLAGEKIKIEREIEDLKYQKKELPESDYYTRLEKLLVQLAALNAKISELEGKK